ncbi:FAD binding domain-containing protein [Rhodobacteraceae bacterium NNCM2]|nr:FAD binding domain-containing protein [Coraliihabitans acroporae]
MLEVITCATMAEATGALSADARYLGGGTLVMRDVNYGDQSFSRIVRVTDPALREIRAESSRIVIGAGVTMAGIMASRELAFLAPAARAVGGPAVRNMATVGGNLHAPHPYGDLATALLALDGIAQMADGTEQPLTSFFAARGNDGLVRAVSIARPTSDAFRFRKVSRIKPKGVSVMSMAAWLNRSAGRLGNVRIAYGAMGPTPLRVTAVEQALEGKALDPAGVSAALAVAAEGLSPPDDALASAWYRREVAAVHLRRLLLGEDR